MATKNGAESKKQTFFSLPLDDKTKLEYNAYCGQLSVERGKKIPMAARVRALIRADLEGKFKGIKGL